LAAVSWRSGSDWRGGLARRGDSRASILFGQGLGTYPRTIFTSKPDGRFPTNFVASQQYRLFVPFRSPTGKGALTLILCEKMLLYSANCRDATFRPPLSGRWEDFGAVISIGGLDEDRILGWLKRLVELSLFDPVTGSTIEIGHVRMLDPQGRDILANGDFSQGIERWCFTRTTNT
jgi:hypothetical protein